MNEKINRLKNKKLALNPYVFEKPSLSSVFWLNILKSNMYI